MDYARWQVEASRQIDGVAAIDYWRASKSEAARAKLEGPPFPDTVGYLWEWALELHGRSGAHMSGLNPLSYSTIKHWAELTNRAPQPHEVQALVALDALFLGAYRDEEPEKPEPKPRAAWPEKKDG